MALLSVAPFKVHFTSLSRYWSPCTLSHSSLLPRPFKCFSLYCAAGGLSLYACVSLCIFNLLCLWVCVDVWKYVLPWWQVCLHSQTWVHGCLHVYTMYILVFMRCLCACLCALVLRPACLHSQMHLCPLVSTYISAYSERSLSEGEAERTHFQPTVLPRCLLAEWWFPSSSIMARCKKSKKQPSGPGIRTAYNGRGRRGGGGVGEWHCCCYSDHKSVRLEPTYISYKYGWSSKATKGGKKKKKEL